MQEDWSSDAVSASAPAQVSVAELRCDWPVPQHFLQNRRTSRGPRRLFARLLARSRWCVVLATAVLALGQIQLAAAAAYLRVGDGSCFAQGAVPVQGLSRRDVTHLECRSLCNETCIGYSYRPCERSCTLHGDPSKIVVQGDWAIRSGGSRIVRTSEQCGEACFARMKPCPSGFVESSGVDIQHPEMEFDSSIYASCPRPYVGQLDLRCGMLGVTVLGGRCKQPCPPGEMLDGSFLVKFEGTVHGQEVIAPCPGSASGEIIMSCTDGESKKERGRCGFNCEPASVRAGKAAVLVDAMLHNAKIDLGCPAGFSGKVTLECVNGMTSLYDGMCYKNCDAGEAEYYVGSHRAVAPHGFIYAGQNYISTCSPTYNFTGQLYIDCVDGVATPNTTYSDSECYLVCPAGNIGPGVKAVAHGRIPHGDVISLDCNSDAIGRLDIRCTNGTASIEKGECLMHCLAGNITSNRVRLEYPAALNGSNVTIPCPVETHNGNLTVECDDGTMKLREGYCGANCPATYVRNNYAVVNYPMVLHDSKDYFPCPPPYVGSVWVFCYDGSKRDGGFCGGPCADSQLRFQGAVINYPELNHTQVVSLRCETQYSGGLTFSGSVDVECNNRVVEAKGACYPDCGSSMIKDNGSPLWYPAIKSGKSTRVVCDPGSLEKPSYGIVTLSCLEGFPTVTEGSCGSPCQAGVFSSLLTRLEEIEHPEIMHLTDVWFECPIGLSGRVRLSCRDGRLSLTKGSCGERCPAVSRKLYGASFVSPLMEHEETFIQNCTMPFEGIITLYCEKGNVAITNGCRSGCFAGTAIVPGGAENASIPYPDMTDSTFFFATCPKNFAGEMVLQCWDGTPRIHNGSCHAFCGAGRWSNKVVELVHYNMIHGEEVEMTCPVTFSGTITLECDSGYVVQKAGDCFKDCYAGEKFIRLGVKMSWTDAIHGHVYPVQLCPAGFFGSVWLECSDGEVDVSSGACFAHCGNGTTPQGAFYGGLSHNTNATVPCPQLGSVDVGCFDGRVTVLGGECVFHCDSGSIIDENNIVVRYDNFTHLTNITGACTGFATGSRTVQCHNRNVTFANRTLADQQNPDEGCKRHCAASSVNTSDQLYTVFTDNVEHGQQVDVDCPEGVLGFVQVRCQDSVLRHVDGRCGNVNCDTGRIASGEATLLYEPISHKRKAAMDCPAGFEGKAILSCDAAVVSIDEVSLYSDLPVYRPAKTDRGREASRLELGTDPFSNRIKLCECCRTPVPAPATKPIPGRNMWTVVYWAAIAGFLFFMSAALGGLYYVRYLRKGRKKLSSVAPAPSSPKPKQAPEKTLALEDEKPEPMKALPYREGYTGDWQWG